MKISEAIEQLQQCLKEFGNLEIMLPHDEEGMSGYLDLYGMSAQMDDNDKPMFLLLADETLFDTLMDHGGEDA